MSDQSQTGFFISFEGSEGCGKSTQIRMLMATLHAARLDPLLVREPGGSPIGENIRHLLQHSEEGRAMAPETELLLFAASRSQLVRQVILPALATHRIVISDRFLDSTTVYQGIARKIPPDQVARINHFAAGPRLPDITFVLDMNSAEGMRRLQKRRPEGDTTRDRMEEEPPAFYEDVRNGYLALARENPARIRVIDAGRGPDEIAEEIRTHLQSYVPFQGIRL